MLEKQDIVCIASQDWDSHLCTPQQTMMRLANYNKVLYVNYPTTFLKRIGNRHNTNNEGDSLRELSVGGAHLFLYSPPSIFLPSNSVPPWISIITSNLNGRIFSSYLKKVIQELNFSDPILWIYLATASNLIEKIEAKLIIYDCIDEWSGYLDNNLAIRNILRKDKELCQGADIVFAGSKSLLQNKRKYNACTYFVPHAADFNNFRKASLRETEIPADISKIKKPIIGLAGMLERRVNIKLLRYLATSHPEWSLVLVGPVLESLDISPLKELPNVHFLGMKEVGVLPNYLKAFDVCIIPYIIDDFTKNIYPLKLHEYMASGKPIVTTRIPACEEYGELIRIADGEEEFAICIEEELKEQDIQRVQMRIKTAGKNTWDDRVEDKSELILRRIEKKRDEW